MLLPVSWAAAFLFSVLNMHYLAAASTPEPVCQFFRFGELMCGSK